MADTPKLYDLNTVKISSANDLKIVLATNFTATLKNYLGDEKRAAKFMSSVMTDIQRNPKLLACTPVSLFNAYLTMASLGFMPSAVSGEAYVLPYNNTKKVGTEWVTVSEAQFQMGYQGLVTLIYSAGAQKITGGIVYEKDKTSLVNGELRHEVPLDLSKEERGRAIGAYVTVLFRGVNNTKYMNAKDILAHATKFSKSYDPTGKHSPWNPANDPELTMWLKTVLKSLSKLLPKNEIINKALAADNEDSVMADRIREAKGTAGSLNMGKLAVHGNQNTNEENEDRENAARQAAAGDETQDTAEPAD